MKVHVSEVHDFPGNIFLVYRLSTQAPDEPPIGHCIHRSAYAHRALVHGFAPDHGRFHQDVTDLLIRESLSEHPEMAGVREGIIHDPQAAADACEIVWQPKHLQTLKAAHPDPVEQVQNLMLRTPAPVIDQESAFR